METDGLICEYNHTYETVSSATCHVLDDPANIGTESQIIRAEQ